ncbi:hypothetical protein [Methylobacterium sp. 77]|uniref:hypothetical protein n=1 Tax=Methylobacterium sp. 77 TaxID=1101192 RepID=UPI000381DDE8|nr:hypothetical protein [Methylobacterium sp. 77]
MTKIALALAAGTFLSALGLGAASAAPAMPTAPVIAGEALTTEVVTRGHHPGYASHRKMRHHHGMRHRHGMRRHRMGQSDPNSRNPSQPGYMQQKGTTSGGPRY